MSRTLIGVLREYSSILDGGDSFENFEDEQNSSMEEMIDLHIDSGIYSGTDEDSELIYNFLFNGFYSNFELSRKYLNWARVAASTGEYTSDLMRASEEYSLKSRRCCSLVYRLKKIDGDDDFTETESMSENLHDLRKECTFFYEFGDNYIEAINVNDKINILVEKENYEKAAILRDYLFSLAIK